MIPGATVTLTSEARGTKSRPSSPTRPATYVFPNVTPDTYTVEVDDGRRSRPAAPGVAVSGGDRVALGAADARGRRRRRDGRPSPPKRRSCSRRAASAPSRHHRRRSRTCRSRTRNFASLTSLAPGVCRSARSRGTRLGGGGQNNIMMDGVSAMDTGNNGQLLR